jgi:hypothetical protein
MYPATTVIIQNAVPPHQFGIATGSLNFFRTLGAAIVVAVFAAIVLGGFDTAGAGLTLDKLGHNPSSGADFARAFRLVFIAAAMFLAAALVALAAVEERPLRGPAHNPVTPPQRQVNRPARAGKVNKWFQLKRFLSPP